MKKLLSAGILLAIFAFASIFVGCGGDEGDMETPAGIAFVTDYNTALSQAQANNQKLVIDFYTDWCQWCKKLDTETYVDPAVVAMSNNMVFAKINAEVDTMTAQKYKVTGYPTIIVANSDGTEIDRVAGYLPAEDFVAQVNDYLKGIGTLDYYLSVVDTVETPQVLMKIADKYAERASYEEALQYYKDVIDLDPKNDSGFTSEAKMQLAYIDLRNERFDEAITGYKNYIKEYKGDETVPDATLWLAVAYRKKGDTASAIKTFEGFLKDFPDNGDTTYALSQIDKLKNPPMPEEGETH